MNKVYKCPHYKVPKPYTDPVAHVLKLFKHPYDMPLRDAVNATYRLYTDRSFKYHIPKTEFNKKMLRYHVMKYFEVEATPIPDEVYENGYKIIY